MSIVFVIIAFSSILKADEVFYDITFSSPEHTVGHVPVTGSSPTRPSQIVFGAPIVSSSLGLLQNQPLVFNTTGNRPSFYYDQIELIVGKNAAFYYVAFDVLTQNLIGSTNQFKLLFDTPTVRNIVFRNNGTIYIQRPWEHRVIGHFTENTLMHCEVYMDMIQKEWTIFVNNNQIHSGLFNPDEDVRSIRFSLGLVTSGTSPDHTTNVGLDNIIVADHVVSQAPPPVADADGPYSIYVGDTLTLDASGSTDPDNDIVSYIWDLNDDEIFETDAGEQAVFDVNFAELQLLGLLINYTYSIHLKVTDSEGQSDVADSTLIIVPKPAVKVALDIMPGSCPNPVNVKSSGLLPIAILGTDDYDITTIDPASIRLAGVGPLRSSYEDVAAPVSDNNDCNCVTEGPDGYFDLTLKFETQRIVEAIGDVNDGEVVVLTLTGVLFDPMPFETPIEGADCILIRGRHKPINTADINKDGVVNGADFAIFAQNWLQSSIVDD
jgi:hypothetical protein